MPTANPFLFGETQCIPDSVAIRFTDRHKDWHSMWIQYLLDAGFNAGDFQKAIYGYCGLSKIAPIKPPAFCSSHARRVKAWEEKKAARIGLEFRYRPDAFRFIVDEDGALLQIVEIVDSNALTTEKWLAYDYLACELADERNISVQLILGLINAHTGFITWDEEFYIEAEALLLKAVGFDNSGDCDADG